MSRVSVRTLAVDALTGVGVGLLLMIGNGVVTDHRSERNWRGPLSEHAEPDWDRLPFGSLQWPLVTATVLTVAVGLALRRHRPRTAYVVVVVGTAGYLATGGPVPLALVAPALCLWSIARSTSVGTWVRWALLALPMLWAAHLTEPWWGLADPSAWMSLAVGVWLILAVPLVAFARREHQASRARLRAEELQRVAYEERLRLARDIHDVVGHSLSMISLQSGVALHLLDRDPAQARASLEAIRTGSKEALTELRRTLGVFRSSASDELLAPAPGLDALGGLVDGAAAAGRTVRLHLPATPGWAESVSEVVQQTAYRIAQESVTNFVRHTRTGTLDLTVACGDDGLVLTAVDDSRTPPDAESDDGQGLRSIAERVAALGGEARIGPEPANADQPGGWGVRVRLPLATDGDAVPAAVSQDQA